MNYQALTLQELPDRVPTGQRPRSVEVVCIGDLIDKCKPGDRVTIFGSYRIIAPDDIRKGQETCIFSTNLLANNIIPFIDENVNSVEISSSDIKKCKTLSATPDVIDLLTHSIAPSISGFTEIKRGILCLLLGGNEIIVDDSKMRLRGNINILLIGDPSMAKSQFLRLV
jgi:DNA replication licensing factor MCM3